MKTTQRTRNRFNIWHKCATVEESENRWRGRKADSPSVLLGLQLACQVRMASWDLTTEPTTWLMYVHRYRVLMYKVPFTIYKKAYVKIYTCIIIKGIYRYTCIHTFIIYRRSFLWRILVCYSYHFTTSLKLWREIKFSCITKLFTCKIQLSKQATCLIKIPTLTNRWQ